MRVIVPYEIGLSNIDATNITTEPTYDGVASYTKDVSIVLGSDGLAYQYVGPTGTTHDAPTDAAQTDWVLLGPRNSLRPFDIQNGVDQESVIGTQAERSDSITYTLSGLGRIMGFGFMNVEAVTIRVRALVDAVEVYDETYTLQDFANVGSSLWNWLFLPIIREEDWVNTNVNIPSGADIEITITNTGGTAKVGAIVFGLVQELGAAMFRPQWGLSSYSIQNFDGFKRTLLRLNPSDQIQAEVSVPFGAEGRVRKVLRDLDGVAAIYQTDENRAEYTTYGVLKSAQFTGVGPRTTFLNVTIEGL